ncbi:putative serine/threonine-protein kinase [Tetrabaena socialis]|uniref:Putative serine/threonine-protein kinase n=1 Tax=Tetrabaena socialis TaxID=47790 RepID=A0A2J7ZLI4_9CHLO|nr:putative serine/threonine-protein kinase [Tetrabaena socialis]|eukprot:PNH01131.1 putative serine/threonine-protein kinase [Tetrabaena socialis]
MRRQWSLAFLLLALCQVLVIGSLPEPSPPHSPAPAPTGWPPGQTDSKTPEAILQLYGSTVLPSCSELQLAFLDLLDTTGSVFYRNQLCYVQEPEHQQQPEERSFVLSAVLPSLEAAMGVVANLAAGVDTSVFLATAGVPCGSTLAASTLTEDSAEPAIYSFSCDSVTSAPGSSGNIGSLGSSVDVFASLGRVPCGTEDPQTGGDVMQPPPEVGDGAGSAWQAGQAPPPVDQSKKKVSGGLPHSAIIAIAALASAALVSTSAVLFVLYYRKHPPAAATLSTTAAGDSEQQGEKLSWVDLGQELGSGSPHLAAKDGGAATSKACGDGVGAGGALMALNSSIKTSSRTTTGSSSGDGADGVRSGGLQWAVGLPGSGPLGGEAGGGGPHVSLMLLPNDGDSVAFVSTTSVRPQSPGLQWAHSHFQRSSSAQKQPQSLAAAGNEGLGGLGASSAFGVMDVFRGAANATCLSAASSAAPSTAGGVVARAAGLGCGAGCPMSPDGSVRTSTSAGSGALVQQHQQQRPVDLRPPAAAAAVAGEASAPRVASAHPPASMQPPPRELTLLELFKQSPLAGAVLATPPTSGGGAMPSPSAPAAGAYDPRQHNPSDPHQQHRQHWMGVWQHSSPAAGAGVVAGGGALERLSMQLARNIAALSGAVGVEAAAWQDDTPLPRTSSSGRGWNCASAAAEPQEVGSAVDAGAARLRPASETQLQRAWTYPEHTEGLGLGGHAGAAGSGIGSAWTSAPPPPPGRSNHGSSGSGPGAEQSQPRALSSQPSSRGALSTARSTTTSAATSATASATTSIAGIVATRIPGASGAGPPSLQASGLPGLPAQGKVEGTLAAAASSASPSPCPSTDLDLDISPRDLRIQTDSLLGAGAFGSVYRGIYRGQQVAIKVLHHLALAAAAMGAGGNGGGAAAAASTMLQRKEVEAFRSEIGILSRLSRHPNIVRVLGGCADPAHPFLVMELMPRCLHHDVHRGGLGLELGLAGALAVGRDVASGLTHLAASGVVHRDLKPANILLDAAGTAKITDFGLARYHLKPYISTQQPDAGSVCYMSPEAFDPAIGRLSSKCDVYSFGVLLWECITKEHPWAGESNVAIIYRVAVHGMRLPLPADQRVCPPRLGSLLTACMAYSPADRPDISHVLAELEAMLRLVVEGGVEALLREEVGGVGLRTTAV